MTHAPDFMPVLSRGSHPYGPKNGGCFMEVASYLAGEEWSDAPECTDSSLATLCRVANDVLPDDRRQEIAHLIPDVIGTSGELEVQQEFLQWLRNSYGHHAAYGLGGQRLYVRSSWMRSMDPDELVEAITRIIKNFRRIAGLDPAPVSSSEWRDARELVSA